MAHLELSAHDRNRLASAVIATLENLKVAAADPQGLADRGVSVDDINSTSAAFSDLLDRLKAVQFNIKDCVVCGTEFEASNPRKQTCSDACRQALSRSKRAKPIFSIGDLVQSRKDKNHSFTVTKIRWSGGYYFVTGADGTGLRESELKRAKASHTTTVTQQVTVAPSQPDRDPRLPISTPKDVPTIEGTLDGCHTQAVPIPPAPKGPRNRKVWHRLRVTVKLQPDGTHAVHDVTDHSNGRIGYRNEPPVTEAVFHDGFPEFTANAARNFGGVIADQWVFSFGMHVDGTPWIGDLQVPDWVIAKTQEVVTEAV